MMRGSLALMQDKSYKPFGLAANPLPTRVCGQFALARPTSAAIGGKPSPRFPVTHHTGRATQKQVRPASTNVNPRTEYQ